jgi:ABC-type Mn2+/Zn2+ transport system ATPase subunit
MRPALIEVEQLTCGYGNAHPPALEAVDLRIEAGQFTGIVGPSGSGKTTLLRALLGSIDPTSGNVRRAPGLRLGYVPQVETVDWSFPITVGECVVMARTGGRRLPWPSARERRQVAAVLDRLGVGELVDRHIRQLSGGQQQRVFIARALLGEPDLIVLDEPTSGVDVATRHEVLHLLAELNHDGLAVALTTHDLNGMAAHLPHIVCLNRTVVASGAPSDVLTVDVLERTYGARMEVLQHAGLPVVIDRHGAHRAPANVVALRPQIERLGA